ncbi:MAG: cytochrome c maturation protein CcmE [Proteobacteria bacterium]|nr:cytochrome c maturation protein CcmE [Pseudomonadota bacterium]
MNPKRKSRLFTVIFLLTGATVAVALMLVAANEDLNVFYPPEAVVGGEAPINVNIRAGGMVKDGSVMRTGEELDVQFELTDYKGSEFKVFYSGILPDLFREGQGVLVHGQLEESGGFRATRVLAKHDENYMPPELAGLHEGQKE